MLKLPDVTLICLTSVDIPAHQAAIEYSCRGIEFGDVKMVVDYKIKSIDDWNYKVIYELWRYVFTTHALLIHADGYVLHPELWNPDWLLYDYIGAPWPLPKDNYSYRDANGTLYRVGNSVSLRSRKILTYPFTEQFPWKSYYGNTNEDGFLCVHNRKKLEELGCKFAPLKDAKYFSKEHEIPENKGLETFAFHQV